MGRQQGPADSPNNRTESESKDEDEDEKEEEEDEKAKNENIVNQWLIDDVVKELIEMELEKREKAGDT